MSKLIDLTGKVYGRLTVISRTPPERTKSNIMWDCQCECGKVVSVFGANLGRGHTKSCGCLSSQLKSIRSSTHGDSGSPEYIIWTGIKARCCNPKNPRFSDWGGRGITVCDEWLNSYESFLEDMGRAPSPQHSIDRKNNNLGYNPDNCRWATMVEQANNTSRNKILTYNGKSQSLANWCRELGLTYNTIQRRLFKKWTIERALGQPERKHKKYT